MHFGGKTGCIEKMFVKLEMTRASPGSSLVSYKKNSSVVGLSRTIDCNSINSANLNYLAFVTTGVCSPAFYVTVGLRG